MARSTADPAARLRDFFLGGVPLPRAAAAAGLTVAEAERLLTGAGVRLAPEPRDVGVEVLRRL